ncbi:replication initiator protein A [Undibacterium sp. Di26W]|uniref:replication initiator protein A n=1 Tax=Undibacterium sp. Di26W TaxID=3413035 RepID=UPI003BF23AD7
MNSQNHLKPVASHIAGKRKNAVDLVRQMHLKVIEASHKEDKRQFVQEPSGQFFLAELEIISFKSDLATLEVPIFSLTTKKDMKLWKWSSSDGQKTVEVAPGFYGRATIHDKDVLIYCISHLVHRKNIGGQINRTVRFTAHNFFMTMRSGTRKDNYVRLKKTLDRLKGTQIKTSESLNEKLKLGKGFGLIEEWQILEKSAPDLRKMLVSVTLSDWLFHQVVNTKVLTIHPDYFLLRKPLERRLYEIARKHVGNQGAWKMKIDGLRSKCGSSQSRINEFRAGLECIRAADNIPDYRFLIKDGYVHFYSKDTNKLLKSTKKIVDN